MGLMAKTKSKLKVIISLWINFLVSEESSLLSDIVMYVQENLIFYLSFSDLKVYTKKFEHTRCTLHPSSVQVLEVNGFIVNGKYGPSKFIVS